MNKQDIETPSPHAVYVKTTQPSTYYTGHQNDIHKLVSIRRLSVGGDVAGSDCGAGNFNAEAAAKETGTAAGRAIAVEGGQRWR